MYYDYMNMKKKAEDLQEYVKTLRSEKSVLQQRLNELISEHENSFSKEHSESNAEISRLITTIEEKNQEIIFNKHTIRKLELENLYNRYYAKQSAEYNKDVINTALNNLDIQFENQKQRKPLSMTRRLIYENSRTIKALREKQNNIKCC